jgi:hypothetical protein
VGESGVGVLASFPRMVSVSAPTGVVAGVTAVVVVVGGTVVEVGVGAGRVGPRCVG